RPNEAAPICCRSQSPSGERCQPATPSFSTISSPSSGAWRERVDREDCLKREHTVAQRRVLLIRGQPTSCVGDPARRQAHKPFHELGCWSRSFALVQDRGCGG